MNDRTDNELTDAELENELASAAYVKAKAARGSGKLSEKKYLEAKDRMRKARARWRSERGEPDGVTAQPATVETSAGVLDLG